MFDRRGLAVGRWLIAVSVAAVVMGLSATVAFASAKVWLNWVYTGANGHQYGAIQSTVHQVATEPANNRWACANIWKGTNNRVFSRYYCGRVGSQGETPYVNNVGNARPEIWNDWNNGQDIWAWEDYSG